MGGLFSSYILFTKPELFNYYLISSPSWWWGNKKFVFNIESNYAAHHKKLTARVYLSVGEDDGAAGMVKPWKKFVTVLRERKYQGLNFISQTYPGKDHLTVMDVAVYDGLKAVFQMKDSL
jgi:predicted alpha/beta superfamily hydrolase